jgi:hypothetical protein
MKKTIMTMIIIIIMTFYICEVRNLK